MRARVGSGHDLWRCEMTQRKWTPLMLHETKDYITEQFVENGDSAWIEGWICGATDPSLSFGTDEIKEQLFDHLQGLRAASEQ
jgi:hypothetical protein